MDHLTTTAASGSPPPYVHSMEALRAEFRARGWESPNTLRILAQFSVHVALTIGGGWLFLASEHLLVLAAGALLCTFGSLGIGTNAHTASHGATFRNRKLDMLLTLIGYPLLLGVSATFWIHKHVHVHHRATNVAGVDDDIDLTPVFAILEPQVRTARGLARRWYKLQWLAIIPAIALNGINMVQTGMRLLLARLRDPQRRQIAHWMDLGAMVAHVALWLLLAFGLGFSPDKVLLLWAVRTALMGYALFVAFAPAHMPLEAMCLAERPGSQDEYVLAVMASTINYRTGWLGRLVCSGVEYQIEHHLFPRISHVHYPKMATLVEAYCAYHNYPYRTVGWAEGVWKALRVFREPKPVVHLGSLTR